MIKPAYIEKIEQENKQVFSVVNLEEVIDIKKIDSLDKNKNLLLVHTDAEFALDKLRYHSKLYKTSNEVYIYCKSHLGTGWDSMEITVYHKPENLNEVIIFLKQLTKK